MAALKDNINEMILNLKEQTLKNAEQDWLKTNLARISGLMQGHRDLPVVAELIMDELVPLVSAQYGAFYLAEDADGGPELRLVGSYGYPDDDGRPTRTRLRPHPGRPGRAQPPIPVRMTKATVNRLAHALDDLASHMDSDQNVLTGLTEDYKEGTSAFREKRKPAFKGR